MSSEFFRKTEIVFECCRSVLADSPWWATPWKSDASGRSLREIFEDIRDFLFRACNVSIAGEVKKGKSTFINTLLGRDIAPTGTTATTATQIRFVYSPKEDDVQVDCYWRAGENGETKKEKSSLEFVKSLQGDKPEILEKAKRVAYFEIHLCSEFLREVTLVDTPGSNSSIETHQKNAEAAILNESAAIIYLTDCVAREADAKLIEQFNQATGVNSHAINSMGIMGKIDKYVEVLKDRKNLAQKIAESLSGKLLAVIPISAVLYQIVKDEHILEELRALIPTIPSNTWVEMLDDRKFFNNAVYVDKEHGIEWESHLDQNTHDRLKGLFGDLGLQTIKLLGEALLDKKRSIEDIQKEFLEYAGINEISKVLKERFFQRERAEFFKCYRALTSLKAIIEEILRERVYEFEQTLQRHAQPLANLKAVIESFPDELSIWLKPRLTFSFQERLEEAKKEVDATLNEMEECHKDFHALELLMSNAHSFSPEDMEELQYLFGNKSTKTEDRLIPLRSRSLDLIERAYYWKQQANRNRKSLKDIMEAAANRYSMLIIPSK